MPRVLAIVALMGLWGGPASTAIERVSLEWEAPAQCPDRDAFGEALAGELRGWTPRRDGPVVVVGHVTGVDAGFVATLSVTTPWGDAQREISAGDCEALIEASALLVAIALDPISFAEAGESEASLELAPPTESETQDVVPPEPGPERAPEPELEPVSPTDRETPPRAENGRLDAAVALGGGVDLFGLPGVGGAVVAVGGFRFGRARIELRGAAVPARTARVGGVARARLHGVRAGLQGCFAPAIRKLSFPLCGGAEAGGVWGRGLDVAPVGRDARPWVVAVVHAGVSWQFADRWGIRGGIDGLGSVLRPRFEIRGVGEVFRVSPLSATVWAGVERAFGAR